MSLFNAEELHEGKPPRTSWASQSLLGMSGIWVGSRHHQLVQERDLLVDHLVAAGLSSTCRYSPSWDARLSPDE